MADLLLRDSITAADIPLDGLAAVAGYGDGPWMWTSKDWKRFDDAKILALSVVIDPAHQGDILDVERADAEPIQVPGWIRRFDRPHRRKPTIYCNRSTWRRQPGSPAITVTEALATAGFPITAVDWWAATLDGTTDGTDGAVAVQWKGAERTGGHYDESIILDPTWIGRVEGSDDMTRDDWAAIYGAFFVLVLRDPPGEVVDKNGDSVPDPVDGGFYGQDYYWADQTLQDGPRPTIRKFLDDVKKQAAVPIPLKPVPGPAGPPGDSVSDDHIAEIAAAEIERRVGNG